MNARRMHALILEMDGGPSGTWWELSTTDTAGRVDRAGQELEAADIGPAVTALAAEGYAVEVRSLAWWNTTGHLELDTDN